MEEVGKYAVTILESAIKVAPDVVKAIPDITHHKKKSQLHRIMKDLHPEYTDLTFIRARDIEDAQDKYDKLICKGYSVLSYDSSGVMLYH